MTDPGSPAAMPLGHLGGKASSSPEPPGPQVPGCPRLKPSSLLLGGPRARPASCPHSHRPAGSKAASALFHTQPHRQTWCGVHPSFLLGPKGRPAAPLYLVAPPPSLPTAQCWGSASGPAAYLSLTCFQKPTSVSAGADPAHHLHNWGHPSLTGKTRARSQKPNR